MIRPMIFARESDVIKAVKKENLPVIESACPADKNTERKEINNLVKELSGKYENLETKIIHALQKGSVSGW